MDTIEEKAVCACLEVVYKATANENGAMTEAWWCRRCNTRFVRQFWLQKAHEEAYEEGRADMRELAAKVAEKMRIDPGPHGTFNWGAEIAKETRELK